MAYKHLSPVYKIVAFTESKRRNDINTVAAITGYSRQHVGNVLRGRRNNDTIVNKAYRLVKDRQTNLQKIASLEA